jgi:hypothetical protein
MVNLLFGKKRQIAFNTNNEFYESLGFLSKNNDTTSLHWEHNETSGAWGSEGRIHFYIEDRFYPLYFSRSFTAGTGNIIHRVNCNEYVEYISTHHYFQMGHIQNTQNILTTIPSRYLTDFNRGLFVL